MDTILSGGKTIRILCAEPAAPMHPAPAVLLLHGAGGNVPFWFHRLAPRVIALGWYAYAVHYFDRTGTPTTLADSPDIPLWIETIRDTLGHIARTPQVDPRRIALMGISLGGFLALALAAEPMPTGPGIRAIVEVAGGLVPPARELATADFPPTLIVHGDRDQVVQVDHAYALAAQLRLLGVEHTVAILPGETHWLTPQAQARVLDDAMDFLSRHLTPAPLAVS